MTFLKKLINRIINHDINSYAAQSAYYLLLSIFPFIILIIIVITNIGISNEEALLEIIKVLPKETSYTVENYLNYSKQFSSSVYLPLIITSILMSSNSTSSLITAFNVANDIKESRPFLKRKIVSILSLILIMIMIIIGLTLPSIGAKLINKALTLFGLKKISVNGYNNIKFLINFINYTSVIGVLYYILPNKKFKVKELVPGIIFSTIALALSSMLFGYIITNFTKYSLIYGSISAIIILLLWLFLCSFILIIGVEINSIIIDKKNASN